MDRQKFFARVIGASSRLLPSSHLPAGNTVTVNLGVDIWDAPGGNGTIIGELHPGDEVAVADACPDSWCHVTGDKVPKGDGYVYDGPDYDSLKN